ncbi:MULTISPECIES: hypothetical protein [unclassified Kitasatospora]|uniref:hypothetical protein n=1 Tax=unclassified Kitasatospora TaxID=2633591 RepID=UPI000711182C|nr:MULTISPECIES: hypothetical protein [unclassified Kitasatospora]KQV13343.1 hypothetical protein ASC99_09020 [Kitasatospora sp. Root107]KRB75209.1 hypothetical protein ASE03_14370 [Kitasatospora sp. Root187]
MPQDRATGPEHWYEYLAPDDSLRRLLGALLITVGCGVVGTVAGLGLAGVDPYHELLRDVPTVLVAAAFPAPYVALIALGRVRRYLRYVRRPLRVRVGTPGLSCRLRGGREQRVDWAELSVVRVRPRPGAVTDIPWLIIWAVPGTRLGSSGDFREDGLWGRALVPVARLQEGPVPLAEALRQYSGGRFR